MIGAISLLRYVNPVHIRFADLAQIGMFAYTGLKPEQMDKLAKEVRNRWPDFVISSD